MGDRWGSSEAQAVQQATWDWRKRPWWEGEGLYPQGCGVASPLQGWLHHPTHLFAAGIVAELIIAGMQRLPGIDRIQDNLVPHDHLWGQAEQGESGKGQASLWLCLPL